VMGYHEHIWFHQCQEDINSLYHFERIPGNIPGAYISLESEIIQYIKYHVKPETDKIKINISGDGSKVSRISNFVVLSLSVITDDLTWSSTDQNVFCIVNCKEDYDHLKLAWKPIVQEINTLYEKASIEVEGKHFDLDIWMGGDMKYLQLVLGLRGSLCNYSCPWHRVHKNHKRADNILLPRRQITLRKLCFYYTCKFGVISIKYVIRCSKHWSIILRSWR
jgi:hypothetical protein